MRCSCARLAQCLQRALRTGRIAWCFWRQASSEVEVIKCIPGHQTQLARSQIGGQRRREGPGRQHCGQAWLQNSGLKRCLPRCRFRTHRTSAGIESPRKVSESIPCGIVFTTAFACAMPFSADHRLLLLLRSMAGFASPSAAAIFERACNTNTVCSFKSTAFGTWSA